MTEQYDILIVGGGNAGVSLAAALRRKRQGRVAIADGQQLHRCLLYTSPSPRD